MLKDLKKYITHENTIPENSVSWYLKSIMERCRDDELVNEVIKNTRDNHNNIIDNEISIFDSLIYDYHLSDELNMLTGNIVIRLILRCFVDDFIIEQPNFDLVDFFLEHTYRGNNLLGINKQDTLTDHIEKEWNDLVHEFDSVSDDEFKKMINRKTFYEELYEEYVFLSLLIVVDENSENYSFIKQIMYILDLSEITPGMFFYGSYNFCEYEPCEVSLRKEGLEELIDIISKVPKIRNLNEYDGIINYYNLSDEYADKYLYMLLQDRSSEMEVLF